jgi:hypothetical protein
MPLQYAKPSTDAFPVLGVADQTGGRGRHLTEALLDNATDQRGLSCGPSFVWRQHLMSRQKGWHLTYVLRQTDEIIVYVTLELLCNLR